MHPFQLSRWLEEAWVAARTVPEFGTRTVERAAVPRQRPDRRRPRPAGAVGAGVAPPFPSGINPADVGTFNGPVFSGTVPLVWDHLIYAYLHRVAPACSR